MKKQNADTFFPNQDQSLATRQSGLSLIELMIALAMGLVVVAAMTTLFVNISRSNIEMAKTNSQIENARFAMQFLNNDIVHAGYWAEFVPEFDDISLDTALTPSDPPTVIPDPCLSYASWSAADIDAMIGIPVQVYDSIPASCNSILTDKLANTDVLVVRHANTCISGEVDCEAIVDGKLYFQSSNCLLQLDASQTRVLSTAPAAFILYEKDCTGSGSPPTIATGTLSGKRKFIQTIYYIREWAITSGDGIPTLVRSEFDLDAGTVAHQSPVALVQGIERFRIELAFDQVSDSGETVENNTPVRWASIYSRTSPENRGDGIPEGSYIHCPTATGVDICTATKLGNAVSLRMYVLSRADQPSPGYQDSKVYKLGSAADAGPFNDTFKRHVFSTSMRLHNIAGRRETP
jgi:type IV pilus assembly protein PilW